MFKYVVSANRLLDGLVVYQTVTGDWSEAVAVAAAVDEAGLVDALATGQAAEARQEVTGVYEVEVDVVGGAPVPVRLRERIRAYGPTTHLDFGRTDATDHFQHPDGVAAVRFASA